MIQRNIVFVSWNSEMRGGAGEQEMTNAEGDSGKTSVTWRWRTLSMNRTRKWTWTCVKARRKRTGSKNGACRAQKYTSVASVATLLKNERREMNIKPVQPHEPPMYLPAMDAQEKQLMITMRKNNHVGSDAPHVEK